MTVAGPMAVGTTGRLKPVKGLATTFVFTEVTPGVSFTDMTRLPLARLEFGHQLEPYGAGARFTHTVTITGPLSGLFGRIIGAKIAAGIPAAMRTLAGSAETAAAAAADQGNR